MELLGPVPLPFALSGRYSREYFNRKGETVTGWLSVKCTLGGVVCFSKSEFGALRSASFNCPGPPAHAPFRRAASHLQPEAVGPVRGAAGEVRVAAGPGGSVQRLPADHAGAAAGPAGHGGAVPAARLAAHVEPPARGRAASAGLLCLCTSPPLTTGLRCSGK